MLCQGHEETELQQSLKKQRASEKRGKEPSVEKETGKKQRAFERNCCVRDPNILCCLSLPCGNGMVTYSENKASLD